MRFRIIIKGMPLSFFLREMPFFLRTYHEIKTQARQSAGDFPLGKFYPCLEDRYRESGEASGHYFHHDLLVAGKIFDNRPVKHVDVGSSTNFIAHVACFREIEVLDIRKSKSSHQKIIPKQCDVMAKDFDLADYCDSVSCLHVLEHFGLGRYGDKVDYNGHLAGWENIFRMLKEGGKLYFSVPIGKQRIEFNAHRVFSVKYLLSLMEGKYCIDSFSYVDDAGDLVKDAKLDPTAIETNFGCNYGCGIFELTKL